MIVASRGGRTLDHRTRALLEERGRAEVPFLPDESVTWTNDAETVWFGGWRAPGQREPLWHTDDHGLTAVAGRVWPRCEGWRDAAPVATQLAGRLRREPLMTCADTLAGVFVAASLSRQGMSAVAADPLGLGLIHWGRTSDVVVLSTRASVVAQVLAAVTGSPPRRNAFGAGWLAYVGHAVGPWTGYEDVTVVPGGAVVAIDADGTVELRRPEQSAWRAESEALAADPGAALAQAQSEMIAAIHTARRDPDVAGRVGLTGGKDSRLILALLLADGCATDLDYLTLGADDLPDVVIAKELASTYGLRHSINPDTARRIAWRRRLNEAIGSVHGTGRELSFRITSAVTSGSRNVAEPHLGRLPHPGSLLLSGLCGETLRSNFPASIHLRTKKEASRFPSQFGTAGILNADALARYRREMHEILFEGTAESDSPQDVVDAFYLRQRLRRWAGTTLEVDPEARVMPLYSMTAIRLAFGIGAENRHAGWIHYRLMADACEPLVHVPFANAGWAPGAAGDLVEPATYTDPVPNAPPPPPRARRRVRKKGPPQRTVSRERRANERETDREIMRRLFEPDAANPAFELIDARGVQRALDGLDSLPDGQRLQLYGALSAVIWLGGHELALPRELATG